jgi:hypothetical protein
MIVRTKDGKREDRSRLSQDKFDGQVARKREETGNKLRQPGTRIEKRIGGPEGGLNEVCPIRVAFASAIVTSSRTASKTELGGMAIRSRYVAVPSIVVPCAESRMF